MSFSISCKHNRVFNSVVVTWVNVRGFKESAYIDNPKQYQELVQLCSEQDIEIVDVTPKEEAPKQVLKMINQTKR